MAGAVVKAAGLESRRSQVRPPLLHSGFKETSFFPANSCRFNIVGSLCDREVASSASDRQPSNSLCLGGGGAASGGSPGAV